MKTSEQHQHDTHLLTRQAEKATPEVELQQMYAPATHDQNAAPRVLRSSDVMKLQRQIGNQATQQLLTNEASQQQAGPQNQAEGRQDSQLFESGQLTMEGEGLGPETLTIHWPAGASGVTIGFGYDMKERSADDIKADLVAAGISEANAGSLSGGAGLRGATAQKWVDDNKQQPWATITAEQRAALFRQSFPGYRDRARNLATSRTPTAGSARVNAASRDVSLRFVVPTERWDQLHPAVIEVLTDMAYSGAYSYGRHESINPILMDEKLTPVEQLQQIRPILEALPRQVQAPERRRLRLQFIDTIIGRLQTQQQTGAQPQQ